MRKRPSPAETLLLESADRLRQSGFEEFHGFQIAKEIAQHTGARYLMGYGTLYAALSRLVERGLLSSRWEGDESHRSGPRRRYYRLVKQ